MTFTCGKIVYKIFPLKCCVCVVQEYFFVNVRTHTHIHVYTVHGKI